jgi:serine/threonine protein phosphatase PrpC
VATAIHVHDVFGCTDPGHSCRRNEDRFLVARLSRQLSCVCSNLPETESETTHGHLLAVADGVGGRRGGAVASDIVTTAVSHYLLNRTSQFLRLSETSDRSFRDELVMAIEYGQRELSRALQGQAQRRHVMTTLTLAYIVNSTMYVAHVGDSRCYLIRGSRLSQLTKDHTVAQKLIDSGTLTSHKLAKFPATSHLWNRITPDSYPSAPDVQRYELMSGDRIMLCTDGISDQLPDIQIMRSSRPFSSCQQLAGQLIHRARLAGSADNATAIVAQMASGVTARNLEPARPSVRRTEAPARRRSGPKSSVQN